MKDDSCTQCPNCKFNFSADTENNWKAGLKTQPRKGVQGSEPAAVNEQSHWVPQEQWEVMNPEQREAARTARLAAPADAFPATKKNKTAKKTT